MLAYQLLVGLTIVVVGLTNPLADEPKRCCFSKQFTAKVNISTQAIITENIPYTSYVIISFCIENNSFFLNCM